MGVVPLSLQTHCQDIHVGSCWELSCFWSFRLRLGVLGAVFSDTILDTRMSCAAGLTSRISPQFEFSEVGHWSRWARLWFTLGSFLKLGRSRVPEALENSVVSRFNTLNCLLTSSITICKCCLFPHSLWGKKAAVSWSDSCFLLVKQKLAKTFELTQHDSGIFHSLLILNQTRIDLIWCRGYRMKCE